MKEQKIQSAKIEDMANGWFIGDFEPSLYKTPVVEVAVKYYKTGDRVEEHCHKLVTEYLVIVEGEAEVVGRRYKKGDIVVILPGVKSDFTAITDVSLTVVKIPGIKDDKHFD